MATWLELRERNTNSKWNNQSKPVPVPTTDFLNIEAINSVQILHREGKWDNERSESMGPAT